MFTGIPGKFVQVEDTVRSFKAVVNGEYDHLPEAAFYMVGGIDEAVAKAEKLAQEMPEPGSADRPPPRRLRQLDVCPWSGEPVSADSLTLYGARSSASATPAAATSSSGDARVRRRDRRQGIMADLHFELVTPDGW